jgi:uncharacterized repeat protein (TIGR01451 family)
MDTHRTMPRVLRAATVAFVGLAMVCGILILFGGLAGSATAAPLADTLISSDIVGGAIWTPAGSPYVISGTVSVYGGVLTIEPDVVVRFNSDAELIIQSSGRLAAVGTPSQPIIFSSNVSPTPQSCDWDAIRFNSNDNVVRYSIIEYSIWGLDLREPYGRHDVSYNTFRNNGLCAITPVGGAVIGSTDVTSITHNDFFGNASAVRLSKSSGNVISYNVVSDTTQAAIAFVRSLATPSSDNQVYSNTVRGSQGVGILLELGDFNNVTGNFVYNNHGNGIQLLDQRFGTVAGNQVDNNAYDASAAPTAGVEISDSENITVHENSIYANGAPGVTSYWAGLYVSGDESVQITDNFIHDNNADDGLEYGLNNTGTPTIAGNAICRNPAFELRSQQVATLTAESNWWGTNTPAGEISGNVDYDPWIQLALMAVDNSIPADGVSSTTINITFNDGANRTVPPTARGVLVTTSAGTLSTDTVTVDDNGQASLTLTSAATPGSAVVTATDACGYSVVETVTFAGYVDLVVSKTASPSPYSAGGTITYTISYRNDGNAPASGVVLTETIPASTTVVGPPGWAQVGSSNQYTRIFSDLPPASSTQTAVLVVRIDDSLPAGDVSFTNVVQIGDSGASGPDHNPADNVFTLTVSGGNLPDLWVVKNDNVGPGSMTGPMVGALANTEGGPGILQMIHTMDDFSAQDVAAGELITYTVGYGNGSQGMAPATGVVLSETLPLYTSYAGPACGQPGGWCQVASTRTYTYFVGGPLYPITGDYVYFHVRVDASLPPTVTEVINTVCIHGNEEDLLPDNNCSTEETDVITGTYDLSVAKVVNTLCPNPGDALNYQITVRNQGANDATNAVLREVLPANTSFIGPIGWTEVGVGVYIYDLGVVPVGAASNALFSVQIDPDLSPSIEAITNNVSAQGDGTDSNPADNTYTLVTPVGTTPDLVITKNDNTGDPVSPINDVISYTIGFVNNSHRYTATNVVVIDTLPPGTVMTGPTASLWSPVDSTTYSYSVGILGPGEFGSVPLAVHVTETNPYPYGSEVINHVEIRGDEDECNLENNVATEETPVEGSDAADLEVTKVDNVPFCAVPGEVIRYTISYTNNSYSVAAEDVVLTERIDTTAVDFVGPTDWSAAGVGVYTRAPVPSTVGPREGGTFDFQVRIEPTLPSGQEYITNVVRIDTTTPDWDPTNNVFTSSAYVPEWPDLIVIKNDNVGSAGVAALAGMETLISRLRFTPDALSLLQDGFTTSDVGASAESVDPGDTISYTIVLGNIGRAASNGVVLTETLPPGTTFVGPGYWQQVGENQYAYSLSSPLAAGYGDVLQFIVRVDDPFLAGDRVINTVEIGGNELECDTANNTSTDETPVTGATPIGGVIHLPLVLKGYPEEPPEPPEPTPTPTPTVPVPNQDSHVADLVVDPQSHYVYVASPRDDKVHFIHVSDVNTYTHEYYNDIVVGNGPTGLGAFPIGGLNSRIFVAHPFDWEGGLQYFYPNPADPVAPDAGYVGAAAFKVAVNPGLSRAYVSNYWDYLAAVDTARSTRIGWVGQKNYQGGWGIDVSADTNRAYLATRDTGELVALDGNGDRLLQFGYIPTHFKPPEPCSLYTVAVNENTDHIFVPCPALKKVFVHEETQLEIFAQQDLGTLELREDGWVRVLAPGDVGWLESIPLDSSVVSEYAGVWGITVDEATNRIYLTDPRNDALIVIQDAPLRSNMSVSYVTGSEGAFDEPQGIDVDSERGWVFVANAGNDTVSVLEATSPFSLVTTVDLSGP